MAQYILIEKVLSFRSSYFIWSEGYKVGGRLEKIRSALVHLLSHGVSTDVEKIS